MPTIGLIREGKIPADNRVALTPAQCKYLMQNFPGVRVIVQASERRCFSDREYRMAGTEVRENVDDCDIMLGIKEVPTSQLIEGKTYMFFSHTKKMQPYNRDMLRAIVDKGITLIDYECLAHEDGTRIIGFGFFAGIVGAHNGMMAYGKRTGDYHLARVSASRNFKDLVHTYFGLKLPNIKIAVTGSGRVAHGVLEIMNLMGIHETEPEEYLEREFKYPVYVHLKGAELYGHKLTGIYNRNDFHANPADYACKFPRYLEDTDILMNGVYWDKSIPRLFEPDALRLPGFRIQTIADITDDMYGSVPINVGDGTIEDPVYGIDRQSLEKTRPYLPGSVDVMAVGNLPNELPRDASQYFGEQLIKHVLPALFLGGSTEVNEATIIKSGKLNQPYAYMQEYAGAVLAS